MSGHRGKSASRPDAQEDRYVVTILLASRVGGVASLRPLCEERVVLVAAGNLAQASALARKYGRNQEHTYANGRGEDVEWRFVRVIKVEALEGFDNSIQEVTSRFIRVSQRKLRHGKQ
jgi:hypothetical protein